LKFIDTRSVKDILRDDIPIMKVAEDNFINQYLWRGKSVMAF